MRLLDNSFGQSHSSEEKSSEAPAADPFIEISKLVLNTLEKRGGKAEFCDIEKWADSTQIGKYTLRTIVSDLIGIGKLKAPDGFLDIGNELEPPVPKTIELPHIPENDVCSMKRYLSEYWSVGELRLFDDMNRLGMKDVNEVLKEAVDRGYVVLAPSNVVNATEKLLREMGGKTGEGRKTSPKLSDLM